MNYQIHDNFLDKETFINIQNTMIGPNFPWFYNNFIASKNIKMADSETELHNLQFTHTFYSNHLPSSPYFDLILPIVNKINPSAIMRIKANLGPATPTRIVSGFHIDFPDKPKNLKTAVFYLNNNNGATVFEDGQEVTSVENRLVVFDNDLRHSGVSCTDTKVRSVINFCYFE
jgi:hypothetical protein